MTAHFISGRRSSVTYPPRRGLTMRRAPTSLIVLLTALAVGACEREPGQTAAVTPLEPSSAMPTVREIQRATTIENSLASTNHDVVVSDAGSVAFGLPNGEQVVRIVDSLGQVVGTIGRRGEGPGELQMPRLLDLDESVLTMFDGQLLKLLTLAVPSGKVGEETRLSEIVFPSAVAGERGVLVRQTSAARISVGFLRDGADKVVPAIAQGDTLWPRMFPAADDPRAGRCRLSGSGKEGS